MPNEAPYFSDTPFLQSEADVASKDYTADEIGADPTLTAAVENSAASQAALTKPVGAPGDTRAKTSDAFTAISDVQ